MYKEDTNYQVAAGPGPGPALPLAWAGPAAAWYFVFILYIFDVFEYSPNRFICRGSHGVVSRGLEVFPAASTAVGEFFDSKYR